MSHAYCRPVHETMGTHQPSRLHPNLLLLLVPPHMLSRLHAAVQSLFRHSLARHPLVTHRRTTLASQNPSYSLVVPPKIGQLYRTYYNRTRPASATPRNGLLDYSSCSYTAALFPATRPTRACSVSRLSTATILGLHLAFQPIVHPLLCSILFGVLQPKPIIDNPPWNPLVL